MRRAIATWALLAVLGIVVAAGLTLATSRIVGQHIGLSSEPGSAGDRLAAPARTVTVAPPRTVTVAPPTTVTVAPPSGDGESGDD
jgi:hypothetical protein